MKKIQTKRHSGKGAMPGKTEDALRNTFTKKLKLIAAILLPSGREVLAGLLTLLIFFQPNLFVFAAINNPAKTQNNASPAKLPVIANPSPDAATKKLKDKTISKGLKNKDPKKKDDISPLIYGEGGKLSKLLPEHDPLLPIRKNTLEFDDLPGEPSEIISEEGSESTPSLLNLAAFGPKRYNRTNGAPNVYNETFPLPQNCANGTFKMIVKSGEANGSNRVSSAIIKLNNTRIFSQSDFNQNVYTLERPLSLMATNTLEITLQSNPGSYLTIEIIGQNCSNPDITPPDISITAPASGTTTQAETINIQGTASDTGANASGVASVAVNGRIAVLNTATNEWNLADFPLTVGANIITARAVDNAGNFKTASVTVTRREVDNQPPTITITSPENGFSTFDSQINVTGTAFDEGTAATGVRGVVVNGNSAIYNPTTGQWTATLVLSEGSNTITAVATDNAPTPNQSQAQVQGTRVRTDPPGLIITSPVNGSFTSNPVVTVAGAVSTNNPGVTVQVAINGQNAPLNGGQFAAPVNLTNGVNTISVTALDSLGQQTQTGVTITNDILSPTVALLNVPAVTQAGTNYRIQAEAADATGIGGVVFTIDGEIVAADATAPYEFTLALPPSTPAGRILSIAAVARDLAGLTATDTRQTIISGPAGISGYVFDDTTGYVVSDAMARYSEDNSAATDENGSYSFITTLPSGIIRVSKNGYTPAERFFNATAGFGTELFDARLTPQDPKANIADAQGMIAARDESGRIQIQFGANSFPTGTDIRITPLSPQGLLNLLPYGWSPVSGAVFDVRPLNSSGSNTTYDLSLPAGLIIASVENLTAENSLVLARYDETTHSWVIVAKDIIPGQNGSLAANLPKSGQYAFLIADTGATAPPAANAGQALPSSAPADSSALETATANAVSNPLTALYSSHARSTISFVANAPNKLPSGVSIETTFDETYIPLADRNPVSVDRPAQDFILYSFGAATQNEPNKLGAFFVAKPTDTGYSLSNLLRANIHVEIRSGRLSQVGILINSDGGIVRGEDGSQLEIPAGASNQPQSVFFNRVALEQASISLPENYETIAVFDLNLTGGDFAQAANISFPSFAGDNSRIVVAKVLTAGGMRGLKIIARGIELNGRILSTIASIGVPEGVGLSGVNSSGRYVFVRVPAAFGYIKGTVKAGPNPVADVRVIGDKTPFIDVTKTNGNYVILGTAGAGTAGTNQVFAAALRNDATGQGAANLAGQDSVADVPISVATAPLQVVSVTPANNSNNVSVNSQVTLNFNKPINPTSITGSSFRLSTLSGNPVIGSITVLAGGRSAVFSPNTNLFGATDYRVQITGSIRDIYGNALTNAFESVFRTANAIVRENRLRSELIRISYPDENGVAIIRIPAGAVPNGSTVIAINQSSGSTVTTVAGNDEIVISLFAQVGDEISIIIRGPDGTEYVVNQAAYRRPDGFTTVGANGGSIVADDGETLLTIPHGAIEGQAHIKMTPKGEETITLPRTGEMSPTNVPFGAGIEIRAEGSFTLREETHLEIPAPAGVEEGRRVAFMKPGQMMQNGQTVEFWETVTSGKVENGKFKTTSPPFFGLSFVQGVFIVYVFMPTVVRAIYGQVREGDGSGNPPIPVANILCMLSEGGNSFYGKPMGRTNASGRFAFFDFRVSSADYAQIQAIDDAQDRVAYATAIPPNIIPYDIFPGLTGINSLTADFNLPRATGGGNENQTPPRMRAFLSIGQTVRESFSGAFPVGISIKAYITLDKPIAQINGNVVIGGQLNQPMVWQPSATLPGGVLPPDFIPPAGQVPCSSLPEGSNVPCYTLPPLIAYESTIPITSETTYLVSVNAYTIANNPATRGRATGIFIGQREGTGRGNIPNVAPTVLSSSPVNGAEGVDPSANIRIEFSEPVKNLIAGSTIYLLEEGGSLERIGGTLTTPSGNPISANMPDVYSARFAPSSELIGGRRYSLHVSTAITDWDTDDQGPRHLDYFQDPENPGDQDYVISFRVFSGTIINDQPLPERSTRIAIADDYAATLLGGVDRSTVTLYNILNPQQPGRVGFVNVPQRAWDIDFKNLENDSFEINGTVYSRVIAVVTSNPLFLTQPANIWFISADIPSNPQIIGVTSLFIPANSPANPLTVRIHEGRAYVGNIPYRGVMSVDIAQSILGYTNLVSNGIDPKILALTSGGGVGFEAKKQTVQLGEVRQDQGIIHNWASVLSLDVVRQDSPRGEMPFVYAANDNGKRLAVLGFQPNLDHIGTGNTQIGPIGQRDIRIHHLESVIPADTQPRYLRIGSSNNCGAPNPTCQLAILLGASRLWIYNIDNPASPSQFPSKSLSDLGITGLAHQLVVEQNFAYILVDNDVVVIDFSDPANPRVASRVSNLGSAVRGLAVKNGFIYTLSPNPDGTGGMNVSIARASSQVFVYGVSPNSEQRCANPVVIDRAENRMRQEAEIFFQVFGRTTRPGSQKIIIRKNDEQIGEIPGTLAPTTTDRMTIGTARWTTNEPIDRNALYTAEVVLDDGTDTEYHSLREPIPFSHLIESYSTQAQALKSTYGPTRSSYGYVLGANANVTLTINTSSPLTAIDNQVRIFGLNIEQIDLGSLGKGRYPFVLQAALAGSDYTESITGTLTIREETRAVRVPGHMVVNGVDVANGNLAISQTDIPEIRNRGISLSFTRSYNSLAADSFNTFGYGWSHNYQILLSVQQFGAEYFYQISGGDGSGQTFKAGTATGPLTMKAEAPNQGTLVRNLNGSFDFYTKERIRYHFDGAYKTDSFDYYEHSYVGNLAFIEEPHGNRLTFFYDTRALVTRVEDSGGRAISFEYESTTHPFAGLTTANGGVNTADACISRNNVNQLRNRFIKAQVGEAWRIKKLLAPGGIEIQYEYDLKGNLKKVNRLGTDQIGSAETANQVWKYDYNPDTNNNSNYEHLLKSATAPNETAGVSRTTNFKYFLFEQGLPGILVKEITQPEGVANVYSYMAAANGLLQAATVRDGNGNPTSYALNDNGNVLTITAPQGAVTQMSWTNFGQIDTVIDPEGKSMNIDYDIQNNPITQTVSGGEAAIITRSKYDPKFSKLAEYTDGNGNTTFYRINSLTGDVFQIDLPTGRNISINYEPNGDMRSVVNEFGFETRFENYDAYGNPTNIRKQISGSTYSRTQNTFDVRSRLGTMTDDLQPSITTSYDALDRVVSQVIIDPAGIRDTLTNSFSYLPEGQQLSIAQSGGGQSLSVVNQYDGLNRLKKATETVSNAGTFIRHFTYDLNSNLLTSQDRRGVTTTKTYNELNFVTRVALNRNNETKTIWEATEIDKIGNPRRTLDHFGFVTRYGYDGLHRLATKTIEGCGGSECAENYTYDANNNLKTFTDANGRTTERDYDAANRLAAMRKPLGHTTRWTYLDDQNSVKREEVLLNLTEEIKSDGLDRPVSRKTSFGGAVYTTTYGYDGRSITTIDPRGTHSITDLSAFGDKGGFRVIGSDPAYITEMRYSAFGAQRQLRDANGRVTIIVNDGFNRPIQINLPEDATESRQYDGEGLLTGHTDRRGVVSAMNYDLLGRRTSTTTGDINLETINYTDSAAKETRTDALGNPTIYQFDPLHRVLKLTNAKGHFRQFTYDGVNLISETDFRGARTAYTYDALNRVKTATDRAGQATQIDYSDANISLRTTTDRRGNRTLEKFDALGRITEVSDPIFGKQEAYSYDGNSNRTSFTDGRNNTTNFEYDKLNRVKFVAHPGGLQIESYGYDGVGNLLRYSDGRGGAIVSTYNGLDNLLTRTDGAGNETKFKFDGEGLLTEKTDPKGESYKTSYAYNDLGSLTGVTDAAGQAWNLTYDNEQNLKTVNDPLGRTVSYSYDELNNLTGILQQGGLATNYSYDENSNKASMTDPKGQVTAYGYDSLDRMRTASATGLQGSQSRQTAYTYDPEGNLTGITDTAGGQTRAYSRTYDGRNRLRTSRDGFGKTVAFEYDAADNLSLITDAAQKSTKYGYDAQNRLQTAILGFGGTTEKTVSYQWYADGLLREVDYGANLKRNYSYDDGDRVLNITNSFANNQTESFDYTYDANSNRETETRKLNGHAARNILYGYDNLDRLTSARYETPGETLAVNQFNWTYDAVGNRLTQTGNDFSGNTLNQTYSYDDNNRLTQVADGGATRIFEYDANGNLKREKLNGTTIGSYEYDAGNQLTRFEATGANFSTEYEYDFERKRIAKRQSNGIELRYTYAGTDVVNEFDGQNALLNRYDLGAGEIIRGEFAGEGERLYFSDALGSTTSLTSGTGSPASRVEYGAFGDIIGGSGASYNALGYTGQRLDGESGLMPLGNGERYYSSALGRFTQQDSWMGDSTIPQSLNRFLYGYNNPFKYVDPSGNEGVIADGLRKSANASFWDTGNESFDWWSTAARNFVAGFVYDAANLSTFGALGMADRNLQKALRGELVTVSDMFTTNWYGGNQDGWNPGNLLVNGVIGFASGAYKLAVGLVELTHEANPVTQIYRSIQFLRDPVGESERRRQAANQMLAGVKIWWSDLSGFTGELFTDPANAMSILADAANTVGPDKTAQIIGEATFDAIMIVDGGVGAVKGARALNAMRLARMERQALQVAIKENVSANIAESKAARTVSNFSKFAEAEKKIAGFSSGSLRGLTDEAAGLLKDGKKWKSTAIGEYTDGSLAIASSDTKVPYRQRIWAEKNNIRVINEEGHADATLVKGATKKTGPLIRAEVDSPHGRNSQNPNGAICSDCEILFKENNVETTTPFSGRRSKKRR